MTIYNPSLSHAEGEYVVVVENLSTFQVIIQAFKDFLTAWLAESSLKLWVRIWLGFLMAGMMLPLAFLPHPFAIASNLVGLVVIFFLNGQELVTTRGLTKKMGWPHIVAWTPVMVVNLLCLTTDMIGWSDGKVTWDKDGARYVAIIFNTVIFEISLVFDTLDTVLYFAYGKTGIERSKWTTAQLVKGEKTGGHGGATENTGLISS